MESTRYALAPSTRVAGNGADGSIVMNVDTGRVLAVNFVGGAIVTALLERATIDEVVQRVARQFDAPIEQVAQDVAPFIDLLVAHGVAVGV